MLTKLEPPASSASCAQPRRAHREVFKAVRARKARSVILAPDIKQYEDVGDFDGVLVKLLRRAALGNIPIIYALSRKQIGQVWPWILGAQRIRKGVNRMRGAMDARWPVFKFPSRRETYEVEAVRQALYPGPFLEVRGAVAKPCTHASQVCAWCCV